MRGNLYILLGGEEHFNFKYFALKYFKGWYILLVINSKQVKN